MTETQLDASAEAHTRTEAHTPTEAEAHTRTEAEAHTRTEAEAHTRTEAEAHTRTEAEAHTRTEARTRTYSWSDPTVPTQVAGMSGMELFAAMNRGELPTPPIMATMGVDRLETPAEGRCTVFMQPAEFHYNPLGSMHGGVISMLLDTAAACAVHTTLPAGMAYTSLDLTVRFLKPITIASGPLRCDGIVVSRGRSTALGEAKLYDAAGRLVAHGTSTCMIFLAR